MGLLGGIVVLPGIIPAYAAQMKMNICQDNFCWDTSNFLFIAVIRGNEYPQICRIVLPEVVSNNLVQLNLHYHN